MRSQSTSSSSRCAAATLALAAAILIGTAEYLPASDGGDLSALDKTAADASELQLEVFINGISTKLIAAVRKEVDGTLSMDAVQLRNVGIRPIARARRPDGRVDLMRLPDVSVTIDQVGQKLLFSASDSARASKLISARRASDPLDGQDPRNRIQTGYGALLNYALNANGLYGFSHPSFDYGGLSGTLEGRAFSPAGVLDNSLSVIGSDIRRLDSTYSYSDPQSLSSFRGGDIITGGLSWTRPTRLAGLQIQSNFRLRPGLVTIPIPGFTSSAAVPSTVDVFLDNSRRFSQQVPAGPFEITDMPVVTGAGTAKVVVRDEKGNETVTESDYFVSDRLLRPSLLDYSMEIGFPRTGYGTEFDRYDPRLFASASLRYGVADHLTLEGHAEGGQGLINAGAGLVTGLGRWGVGSFAASASSAGGQQGLQLSASLELDLAGPRLQGRLQRSFRDYNDIASVSQLRSLDQDEPIFTGETLRSLGQLSLSLPVLHRSYLNLSYAQLDTGGDLSRLASISFSRPMLGGTFTASGFAGLGESNYGLFAGLSIPIGGNMTASTSVQSSSDDVSLYNTISRPANEDNGNFGWQVQYQQNDHPNFATNADVETPAAKIGATLHQSGDSGWGTVRASGAVVAAGGGVFLSDRIDDAFAVVDAGARDVAVLHENRPIGKTGRNGMLLVPDLRSYQRNNIGIDPNGLPLDAAVGSTKQVVIPADRSGVVVSFSDKNKGGAALVTFEDDDGAMLQVGTTGKLDAKAEPFMVGYDGEAFITGLQPHNRVTLRRPSGKSCVAKFDYAPHGGSQVAIPNVVCTSQ